MKNFYLLTLIVFSFTFTLNAQLIFVEDFESYPLSSLGCLNPTIWLCNGDESIQVSDTWARSGTQSGNVPPNGLTNAYLRLGNQDKGTYQLRFYVYVPTGATGYWSLLQDEDLQNIQWNGQWFVDATAAGGSAGVITYDFGGDIPYPNDQWFEILYEIDLDLLTISMWVDNNLFLDSEPYQGTWLGTMNFFTIDSNNDYWIDDIYYSEGTIFAVDDFSADVFNVYPNPVRDVLNINSKATVDFITVYDILGKIILQAQPDVISPSINMSALQSGIYLVNVTIGNATKTIKVIKQ